MRALGVGISGSCCNGSKRALGCRSGFQVWSLRFRVYGSGFWGLAGSLRNRGLNAPKVGMRCRARIFMLSRVLVGRGLGL